jgi:hypothetical protein
MFCPKCGSQNAEETKFCRGCGADISNVLAVVEGKAPAGHQLAEKEIELSSKAWRGLIGGMGFLILSGIGFGLSTRTWVMGFFGLMFAIVFLSTGISRFIQARALKTASRSTHFVACGRASVRHARLYRTSPASFRDRRS